MLSDLRRGRFILHAKRELKRCGVQVYMSPSDRIHVNDAIYLAGYFDSAEPQELVVAASRPIDVWFLTFIHEFCHFEQWRDRRDWWDSHKTPEGGSILGHFTNHNVLSDTALRELCINQGELERDCEANVIKKIDQWKLSIDTQKYAKRANAYVMYYHLLSMTPKWCHVMPMDVPDIIKEMPNHMNLTTADYFDLARRMLPLYNKHCIGA